MDRDLKRKLIRACRIDEPVAADDARYVDFDAQGLRGTPWRQGLARVIEYASGPMSLLATGQPGSGKSTELIRLEGDLSGMGYAVFRVEAGDWIRDDEPIKTRSLLLALVLALHPKGQPESWGSWATENFRRIGAFLNSDVKASASLPLPANLGQIGAELMTRDTLFQEVARHLESVRGLRDDVFSLLKDAQERLRKEKNAEIVILLDGVEKRATGDMLGREEREKYRNHWFGAFLTEARDLKAPVHVVYTVPAFLVRKSAQLAAQFGAELAFLPMVRLIEKPGDSPTLYGPGLGALCEALWLRVPKEHFADCVVGAWLAAHCGGYLRDLLRLVSECIYLVKAGGKITREIAVAATEKIRGTYLAGFETADEHLLLKVQKTGQLVLDDNTADRMDALLQGYVILRYHNGQEWYGVHPLLWPRLRMEGISWEALERALPT